jgi:hypothetical protein
MEELSVDLEIAIINFISQISMSIWLYNDGRTILASTDVRITHTMVYLLRYPWSSVPEAMRVCKFTLDERRE